MKQRRCYLCKLPVKECRKKLALTNPNSMDDHTRKWANQHLYGIALTRMKEAQDGA